MRILLVGPSHNYQTLANDCFPLGIGFIASYLKANLGPAVDCRLEKYPERAVATIQEFRPQVVTDNLDIWGTSLVGLTKMMIRVFISDFRAEVKEVAVV